jgi:hypothetical protein
MPRASPEARAAAAWRGGGRHPKPSCALQLAETPPLCLVKEREEVSMTDTTVRGAGPAKPDQLDQADAGMARLTLTCRTALGLSAASDLLVTVTVSALVDA